MHPGDELGETVELIMGLLGRYRDHWLRRVHELGLTPPQAGALRQLSEPLSQRELAACLHYDASNITAIVDGLERRGLVRRQIDTSDRRVRRLVLTDAGKEVLAKLHALLLEDAPIIGELDAADRHLLRELLAKAVDREAAVTLS